MQCKRCGYRLWNLRSRQCPECGDSFHIRDFEFVPGVVAYCCPHCDQPYYGMDARGHLVPSAFTCVKCNNAVDMESMVLRPAEGIDETQTEVGEIPWLKRRENGWWRSFFRTIRMAMIEPSTVMRRAIPADEGRAYWNFSAWSLTLTCSGAFIPLMIFQGIMIYFLAASAPGRAGGVSGSIIAGILIGGLVGLAIVVLILLLGVLLWGLVTQMILRMTHREVAPIQRTYRALCYSSGAMTSSIVPCVGIYFGWIWWVVSAILMIKQTHRTTGARATLAVLSPPLMSLMTVGGLYAYFVYTVMSGMGPAMMAPAGPGPFGIATYAHSETQSLVIACLDYAALNGALPKHPVELIQDDLVVESAFVSSETLTTIDQIRWNRLRLSDLMDLALEVKAKKIEAFVASLPQGAYAHRAGDFIFTCPGADPTTLSPDVWLVIFSPMPMPGQAANPFQRTIYVGCADGSVVAIPTGSFQNSLQGQQAVRKRNNLPPLPKLTSITHANPAVSTGADKDDWPD
ncbi:MAG: hypothetical protein KDA33_06080 [Phycisphaerales bacterium]|nr:hypothetical protein [Phycisphaerales bacterium]